MRNRPTLTTRQARELAQLIVARHKAGASVRDIAYAFDTPQAHVRRVLSQTRGQYELRGVRG